MKYRWPFIMNSGINKVQDLRIRYPLADERLIQNYLIKYPIYALHELQELEDKIREDHIYQMGI